MWRRAQIPGSSLDYSHAAPAEEHRHIVGSARILQRQFGRSRTAVRRRLQGALFEGEELAGRVEVRRRRVVDEGAEVEEVLVRGGPFLARVGEPFPLELDRVHGASSCG